MTVIGYARVSTRDQNPDQQKAALTTAGVERLFVDRGESSTKTSRPQFDACLDYMREGDTLLVYRLDRLASDAHLVATIDGLGRRGVDLRSLTEPAIDTTSPMGRALYSIIAVLNQLRLDTIRQNTLDGLAHARSQGRIGGRPRAMTPAMVQAARTLIAQRSTQGAAADVLGVSLSTLRRALNGAPSN
jgi:DNA invertase Pin-like site-specific DNA recombinase